MFDRAGLKLGLDRAVLQRMTGMTRPTAEKKEESAELGEDTLADSNLLEAEVSGTPSKLPAGLSKKEVEALLKQGAYGVVMDNDEESLKFCEEDIDQILERRTTVIRHTPVGDSLRDRPENEKSQQYGSSIFSKASFTLTNADLDIDINDPNFWQLWAKKTGALSSHGINNEFSSQSGLAEWNDEQEKRFRRACRRITKLYDSELMYIHPNESQNDTFSNNETNGNDISTSWTLNDFNLFLQKLFYFGVTRSSKLIPFFPKLSRNDIIACSRALIRYCVELLADLVEDKIMKEDMEKWILLKLDDENFDSLSFDESSKKKLPYPGASSSQVANYEKFVDIMKGTESKLDMNLARLLLIRCQIIFFISNIIDEQMSYEKTSTDEKKITVLLDSMDSLEKIKTLEKMKVNIKQDLLEEGHPKVESKFKLPPLDIAGLPPSSWWDPAQHDASLILGFWIHGFANFESIGQDSLLFLHDHIQEEALSVDASVNSNITLSVNEKYPESSEMAHRLRRVILYLIKKYYTQVKLENLVFTTSLSTNNIDESQRIGSRRTPTRSSNGRRLEATSRSGRGRGRRSLRGEDIDDDLDDGEKGLAADDEILEDSFEEEESKYRYRSKDLDDEEEEEFVEEYEYSGRGRPRGSGRRSRGRGRGNRFSRRGHLSRDGNFEDADEDSPNRMKRWTKHEKSEMIRVLSHYGLPANSENIRDPLLSKVKDLGDEASVILPSTINRDWSQIRSILPRLSKKTDRELDIMSKYVLFNNDSMKDSSNTDSESPMEEDLGDDSKEISDKQRKSFRKSLQLSSGSLDKNAVNIPEDRQKRLLSKCQLFDTLRNEVLLLEQSDLLSRLSDARRSGGLPKWWVAGSFHDVDYLKGVGKYGMLSPELILNDKDLCFYTDKRIIKLMGAEEGTEIEWIESEKIGWMKEPVAWRRLDYLIDLALQPQVSINLESADNTEEQTPTKNQVSRKGRMTPDRRTSLENKLRSSSSDISSPIDESEHLAFIRPRRMRQAATKGAEITSKLIKELPSLPLEKHSSIEDTEELHDLNEDFGDNESRLKKRKIRPSRIRSSYSSSSKNISPTKSHKKRRNSSSDGFKLKLRLKSHD